MKVHQNVMKQSDSQTNRKSEGQNNRVAKDDPRTPPLRKISLTTKLVDPDTINHLVDSIRINHLVDSIRINHLVNSIRINHVVDGIRINHVFHGSSINHVYDGAAAVKNIP